MLDKLFEKLLALVSDERGQLSPSKLAALTGHLVIATIFFKQEWTGEFNETRWMIYIGATILHAGYDRTVDTFRALRQQGQPVAGDQPVQGN